MNDGNIKENETEIHIGLQTGLQWRRRQNKVMEYCAARSLGINDSDLGSWKCEIEEQISGQMRTLDE